MKKVSILLACVMLLTFALTACSTPAATQAPAAPAATTAPAAATVDPKTPVYEFNTTGLKANKNYNIAIVLKNSSNAVWLQHIAAAQQAATDMGFTLSSYAPTAVSSVEEQTRILEDLIAKKVDCIILAPVSTDGIASAIKKLNAAGIPVAYDNTRGSGGDYIAYTGLDNIKLGRELGDYIAKKMGEEGKLLILEGVPGQSTSDDRTKGVKESIAKYPKIIAESQPAHWVYAEALDITTTYLTKWPDLKAIVNVGNTMAQGAAEAVTNAGFDHKKIIIGSFDVTPADIESIQKGVVDFTIEQGVYYQAYWAAAACVTKLNGGTPPLEMRSPVTFVDLSNLDKFMPKK
jgi:ribose transport system substrate-binding protein